LRIGVRVPIAKIFSGDGIDQQKVNQDNSEKLINDLDRYSKQCQFKLSRIRDKIQCYPYKKKRKTI
jgi:hypothetical protein